VPAELTAGLSLRPAEPADEAFLRALYAGVRAGELAAVAWSAQDQQAFLAMQFDARERHYAAEFPEADDRIVEFGGERAGRLAVNRDPGGILIVDLALLPAYRGQGVGTALIRLLLDEGLLTSKSVRLHVELSNPARRLYERLGFRTIAESPPYLLMECNPPSPGPDPSPD
jgi:ribosomal protein S18 acetylase RimI-like enzyme